MELFVNILSDLLFSQYKLHHRCSTGLYIGLWKYWNVQSAAEVEQIIAIVTTCSVSCYYHVSIMSGCFLVRSATIYRILQSSGNKNVLGSIRNVFCFQLERCNKMIKIVYRIILNLISHQINRFMLKLSTWNLSKNKNGITKHKKVRLGKN